MPEIDLSPKVPATATWVKLHYEIVPQKPGARLIARVWSGDAPEKGETIRGASGDVFVRLHTPQRISYQFPVTVELKLKVTAYKTTDEAG